MEKYIEVEIKNGEKIRGVFHIPEKRPFPAVIMAHGFTGNRMEKHFIFVKTARKLCENNIGCLRFDFYGSGESDGNFENMTFSSECRDLKLVYNYICNYPDVDKNNIFLLGLSMGGAVVSVTAGELDFVKGIILWNPACNMKEILLREEYKPVFDFVKQTGFADIGGLKISKEFIDEIMSIDILALSKNYKGNVLLIVGEEDTTVPPEYSLKYKEIFPDAEVKIIKEADHTFNNLAHENEVIETTLKWIFNQIK